MSIASINPVPSAPYSAPSPPAPSKIGRTFVVIDHVCDYIPGLSTVVNLIDLFLKCLFRCFKRESVDKNHYFKYVADKSILRCILLLIPVFGVIGVAIYNFHVAKKLFTRAQQHENGEGGVSKNVGEAANLYRQASEMGHIEATLKLAKLYQLGQGVEQSHVKAADLYKFAASNESSEGQYQLALCYKNGHGVAVDEAEHCRLIREASDKNYNAATYQLAEWYLNGHGTHVKQIPAEGIDLLRSAAENDHAASANKLGDCYFNGTGIKQNHSEAFKYYKKAAEKDDSKAMLQLSKCYREGLGVAKNDDEAKKWLDKAMEFLKKKQ